MVTFYNEDNAITSLDSNPYPKKKPKKKKKKRECSVQTSPNLIFTVISSLCIRVNHLVALSSKLFPISLE